MNSHKYFLHPRANTDKAADIIFNVTPEFVEISPDVPKLIMGDFNNCSLKHTLPTYSQYVTWCAEESQQGDLQGQGTADLDWGKCQDSMGQYQEHG